MDKFASCVTQPESPIKLEKLFCQVGKLLTFIKMTVERDDKFEPACTFTCMRYIIYLLIGYLMEVICAPWHLMYASIFISL